MSVNVKDGGTWKDATAYVKDGSTWKQALEVWVKDAGTWKLASGVTFTPPPGPVTKVGPMSCFQVITASQSVTWTYTMDADVVASRASGLSGTDISFSLSTSYSEKVRTVNLTATLAGVSYNWTITLHVAGIE